MVVNGFRRKFFISEYHKRQTTHNFAFEVKEMSLVSEWNLSILCLLAKTFSLTQEQNYV
jgi:hypothetical protein